MNATVIATVRATSGRVTSPHRRVGVGSSRARAMRLAARPGRSRAAASLLLLTLGCFFARARGDFHRGDLIASSRRAQFHGQRTQWHDLLARHCPSFGEDRVVAIALPKPLELKDTDDYKLALAFDHDRHLTGWLTLIDEKSRAKNEAHSAAVAERRLRAHAKKVGSQKHIDKTAFDYERDFDKHPPFVPMVHVRFSRGEGGVINNVDAKVVPVSSSYLRTHGQLVREFHNDTVWPKHVLIRYTWLVRMEVDEDTGVATTLFVFACAFFVASFAAGRGSRWTDISDFVDALGAEEDRRAEAREGTRTKRKNKGLTLTRSGVDARGKSE